MMPCQGCTCAALLHTTTAVDSTLADACASPLPLAMCWQSWTHTVIFSVYESKVEQQQVDELARRDAAEPGSVTRTDWVPRLVACARRLPPLFVRYSPRPDVLPDDPVRGGHFRLYLRGVHGQDVVRWARALACVGF